MISVFFLNLDEVNGTNFEYESMANFHFAPGGFEDDDDDFDGDGFCFGDGFNETKPRIASDPVLVLLT